MLEAGLVAEPVILAFGRVRQEDYCKFTASLGYTERPCLKTTPCPKKKKKNTYVGYSGVTTRP